MATQAALTAETIAGLRQATGRDHYSSESDDAIQRPSNRGSKLKRKAEFVCEEQLDRYNISGFYKRRITHAGFQRNILKRNPRRYDQDGDELEDDESDEEADADAARRNPYGHIRIEELLAPLTSPADLPNHPSLAAPYTSKTLSTMTDQACIMLHRERKALDTVKNLLTKFRGDESYVSCGALCCENDSAIFDTEKVYQHLMTAKLNIRSRHNVSLECKTPAKTLNGLQNHNHRLFDGRKGVSTLQNSSTSLNLPEITSVKQAFEQEVEPTAPPSIPKIEEGSAPTPPEVQDERQVDPPAEEILSADVARSENRDVVGAGATNGEHLQAEEVAQAPFMQAEEEKPRTLPSDTAARLLSTEPQSPKGKALPSPQSLKDDVEVDSVAIETNTSVDQKSNDAIPEDSRMPDDQPGEEVRSDLQPAQHRMTTRAQAQAASDKSTSTRTRSVSPESWVAPAVHPLYQIPETAYPDRDLGLPAHEAEETRRILNTYVQKQEEVVRGVAKLYEGLLRANRMRQTVFKWCKAEGHVGEMSDGEDWYDKDEWGLEEDLKKGHDDEEEDVATQGKKTRKTRAQ